MAPPPRGFNLAGYLVPGTLVALAASMLTLMLLRRGRRATAVAASSHEAPTSPEPSPEDRERLRRALSRVQD